MRLPLSAGATGDRRLERTPPFATKTDCSEPGEFSLSIYDDRRTFLEHMMAEHG